jgi:ketosteroid isomerase-like protein
MSQVNLEIVRRMYDAFHAGDLAALDFVDPGIVVDASHRVDGRVGRGHNELLTILAEWMSTWDDWSEEVEEMREIGDRVLVVSTQRGRGKGSGVEWEGRFWMLYELDGGRISRWTIFDDLDDAQAAIGALE